MEMLRRNVGLTLFLVVAAIAAIVLGLLIQRQFAASADLEKKVGELAKFWENLRKDKISVTDENLAIAKQNQIVARERLDELRAARYQRSFAAPRSYSGVECKNVLRAETKRMKDTLAEAGVALGSVGEFSFDSVLNSDVLPDEQNEVPMLTKQLEVVRELVRVVAESQVMELNGFVREGGLQVAKEQYFDVMPFQITVSGEVRNVKRLVSLLHTDPRFFFRVKYLEFTGDDSGVSSGGGYPGGTAAAGAAGTTMPWGPEGFGPGAMPGAARNPRTAPAAAPRRDDGRTVAAEPEQATRRVKKEDLRIVFRDAVTAVIKFDYIEYHNPNPTPAEEK